MSWRCKHEWKLVSKQFSPPPPGLRRVGLATTELIQQLSFGVTNLRQECTLCGRTEVETVVGDVR